jgi:cytochrome o ubiquinol oxidase operon protein cyoD
MSTEIHTNEPNPNPKHPSVTPYVVGFVLSLVFTVIPYQLVANKILHGHDLLAAILGCAFVQLVIQVVFFLHLGREKKPHFNLFFLIGTISAVMFVVVASIWIMSHLHHNMAGVDVTDKVASDEAVRQIDGDTVGTCAKAGKNYKIELKNKDAAPLYIGAKLCDTITIVNVGDATREIRFGEQEAPKTYAGEDGETIAPGHSKVVTLTELGAHEFYDAINEGVSGGFTVMR